MSGLTCRDLVAFLIDYLDHALAPAERQIFEAHLAECDDCVTYIRSYEETVRLGRAALRPSTQPADQHAPSALVRAVLAARRER